MKIENLGLMTDEEVASYTDSYLHVIENEDIAAWTCLTVAVTGVAFFH